MRSVTGGAFLFLGRGVYYLVILGTSPSRRPEGPLSTRFFYWDWRAP